MNDDKMRESALQWQATHPTPTLTPATQIQHEPELQSALDHALHPPVMSRAWAVANLLALKFQELEGRLLATPQS